MQAGDEPRTPSLIDDLSSPIFHIPVDIFLSEILTYKIEAAFTETTAMNSMYVNSHQSLEQGIKNMGK